MLTIIVPPVIREEFDEENSEFLYVEEKPSQKLQLEHSLISISIWESKWHKSFLSTTDKTNEEVLDYIRCMTLTPHVSKDVYNRLSVENIQDINDYLDNPMTATTFPNNGSANHQIITNEVVYYWMFKLGISKECEKWHIARLLTLIRVYEANESPPKKMSAAEKVALNNARRKKWNTRG